MIKRFSEREMLVKSLENRQRAWDDFDGRADPGPDDRSREDLLVLIDVFRKRLQVVELENAKLKLEAYNANNP